MGRVKVESLHSVAWHGRDYDGRALILDPGEVGEMSEKRAEQLLADYPGRFQIVRETKTAQSVVSEVEVKAHVDDSPGDIEVELTVPRRRRGKRV